MGKRVFLIVLDSVGVGEAPDAELFDDVGCDTLDVYKRQPMIFKRVVLPEPLGPRIDTNSLSLRFKLTSSSAFWTRLPVRYSLQMCLI